MNTSKLIVVVLSCSALALVAYSQFQSDESASDSAQPLPTKPTVSAPVSKPAPAQSQYANAPKAETATKNKTAELALKNKPVAHQSEIGPRDQQAKYSQSLPHGHEQQRNSQIPPGEPKQASDQKKSSPFAPSDG